MKILSSCKFPCSYQIFNTFLKMLLNPRGLPDVGPFWGAIQECRSNNQISKIFYQPAGLTENVMKFCCFESFHFSKTSVAERRTPNFIVSIERFPKQFINIIKIFIKVYVHFLKNFAGGLEPRLRPSKMTSSLVM